MVRNSLLKGSQADPEIFYLTLNNFMKTMTVVGHANSLIKNKLNNY